MSSCIFSVISPLSPFGSDSPSMKPLLFRFLLPLLCLSLPLQSADPSSPTISSYFSPNGGCTQSVVDALGSAKTSALVRSSLLLHLCPNCQSPSGCPQTRSRCSSDPRQEPEDGECHAGLGRHKFSVYTHSRMADEI